MQQYIAKRVLLFIPTIFLVSLIIFAIMRLLPGDPALLTLIGPGGEGQYTQEDLTAMRQKLGTDRPVYVQYGDWIWDLLRGDLGISMFYDTPVTDELRSRIPISLELAFMAMFLSFILALPLGVLSAVKQDSWLDYGARIFSLIGIAIPIFITGLLTIYFLVRLFHWFPPLGYAHLWDDPLKNLKQLIFPTLALAFFHLAFTARVTRSSMLEVLREDFIRTARSKGLREPEVIFMHALKNAILPVVTVSGWDLGRLLAGTVIIETIFLVPGMGRLLVDSIFQRDYTLMQAEILVIAAMVLILNLVIDVAYAWLDPRIRYR